MYNGIYDKEQFAWLHHTMRQWLRLRLSGGGLGKRLAERGAKKIAVYGIGGIGAEAARDITGAGLRVGCFIDRRAAEYPEGLDGLPVMGIAGYAENPFCDIALVTPEYHFREIAEELSAAGVPYERIVSLAMALE